MTDYQQKKWDELVMAATNKNCVTRLEPFYFRLTQTEVYTHDFDYEGDYVDMIDISIHSAIMRSINKPHRGDFSDHDIQQLHRRQAYLDELKRSCSTHYTERLYHYSGLIKYHKTTVGEPIASLVGGTYHGTLHYEIKCELRSEQMIGLSINTNDGNMLTIAATKNYNHPIVQFYNMPSEVVTWLGLKR